MKGFATNERDFHDAPGKNVVEAACAKYGYRRLPPHETDLFQLPALAEKLKWPMTSP